MDKERRVTKQFEEKGSKKPFFPPLTFGTVGVSLLMLAAGVGILGSIHLIAGAVAGVLLLVLLGLSLWSEIKCRRLGIKF